MARVLVLFAHPQLEKSRVHRRLIEVAQSTPGITFHDLYEAYPEFDVDVGHEQRLLSEHDVVILEHPLFWYSAPALVKQWLDLVLEHGWAYGHEGVALRGKRFLCAISTGGPEDAYQKEGFHGVDLATLLSPMRQTAWLCNMDYWPPFVVHGAFQLSDEGLEEHAFAYGRILAALQANTLEPEMVRGLARINQDLIALLEPGKTPAKEHSHAR